MDRTSRDPRELWIPGLVLVLGFTVCLGGWGVLVADRRARLMEASTEIAADTRAVIAFHLGAQYEMLAAFGALWERFGGQPLGPWQAEAEDLLERMPGLVSLSWVDAKDPARRATIGRRAAPEPLRPGEPVIGFSGPYRDASGSTFYRVRLPVGDKGRPVGFLEARVGAAAFLEPLLRGRARGHSLTVRWGGKTLYRRGEPSTDPWQAWWRADETLDLPLGGAWDIELRPTAAFAAARLTPIPHYLLASGLALSVVLAVLTHALRARTRQSRRLAATNRALETRSADLRRFNLELEARVAKRTEELQDVVTELEAFNQSVSHDLRSPLGAILNFAAILEEDYRGRVFDDEAAALLARIQHSANRAAALLEDLLQLSRAGRLPLEREPVDMERLARESFAQLRAAEGRGDDVEFDVAPLPQAWGDRVLLGNVLTNMISNALKYSRGREKRRIAVRGRTEDGECVYQVIDNGRGFDMRYAGKLFGLFERLDPDREIEGTGIGLAVVARIVRRHGGRVWAEGAVDAGACFAFSLPVGPKHTP